MSLISAHPQSCSQRRRATHSPTYILGYFLLTPMTEVERRDLLEVLEDRYDKRSTVCTTLTCSPCAADPCAARKI